MRAASTAKGSAAPRTLRKQGVERAAWRRLGTAVLTRAFTARPGKWVARASLATEVLDRFRPLCAVDAEMCGKPPDLRVQHRQAEARPVLDELHAWFHAELCRIASRSDLAGAFRYALARWKARLLRRVAHR